MTEALDDIAELVPKHDNLPIPEMIASTVKQPMEALDAAIKAMDKAAYTKAYVDLTASCNACHQSANHPEIVIQVPTVSPFPDQISGRKNEPFNLTWVTRLFANDCVVV